MISRRALFGAGAFLALPVGALAKRKESPAATVYRSESFTLLSQEGKRYVIKVALPFEDNPKIDLEMKGKKTTPIYTTDSMTMFGLVSSLTRFMRWGGDVPPTLTVAIGYEDEKQAFDDEVRNIDLTPTTRPEGEIAKPGYGKAEAFRRFLVDILKPEIERRYQVDQSQSVLMGHSYGGLFALDTMVQEPSAFRNYLAISPSLWFDKKLVLNQFGEALDRGAKFPGRLAVFAGEREERIAGLKFHMTSSVLEMANFVSLHRANFGAALVKIVPNASHHTILGTAVTSGLQFLLAPEERLSETF